MGAPLLAYVQNIVREVGCVSGLLVMCGGNASVRAPATSGLLARGLHRGVLHLGGSGLRVLDRNRDSG